MISAIIEPQTPLVLSRDVRIRRCDDDWLIHFRGDAPANLAFSIGDRVLESLIKFASPLPIEAVFGWDSFGPVKPLVDAGLLLPMRFALGGRNVALAAEELKRLRQAVPADVVNLFEMEAVVLYLLAKENPRPEPICELGSYMGGSVIPLALGAGASGASNRVVAVDDHEWHRHAAAEVAPEYVQRLPSTLPAFRENVRNAGVADRVDVLVQDTAAAAADVEAVSLLFVDAAHDERSIRRDLAAWLPRVVPGGVVVFHDYHNSAWPDVERVVDEMRPRFVELTAFQTLAIARLPFEG
jgi:predicted O-methyltransferase YrrM